MRAKSLHEIFRRRSARRRKAVARIVSTLKRQTAKAERNSARA